MLVLSRLKWDVAAVTPNDFVGPLLRRLSKFTLINEHQARIKKHVLNMIDLCSAGKCTLYSVIALYLPASPLPLRVPIRRYFISTLLHAPLTLSAHTVVKDMLYLCARCALE